MAALTAYDQYCLCLSRLADLDAAVALLNWDQEIMMPKGAAQRRAGQLATLAELRHEIYLRDLPPLLDAVEREKGLTETQRLNVAVSRREYEKEKKVPAEFVAEMTRLTSEAQFAWEQAKGTSSFATFAPFLEKIIDLKRRQADLFGYDASPYDALLDEYETGLTSAQLDAYFGALEPELRGLLAELQAGQQPDDSFLRQPVDLNEQWQFTLDVLQLLGFDPKHGRQDRSAHPFSTSMGMEDTRITTRLEPDHLMDGVYSTIHEFGHALYERNLLADAYGLPQAQASSLSIHESQSRFWENEIGRSLAFAEVMFERLRACFPDKLAGQSPETVFRALNRIEPSLIRTQADELTYHLHIILRYRIEKDLIEGRLKVGELPDAWNAGMVQLLGVVPPDDRRGVLQDVHWSIGALGYFPTYSLGSLYAAQWRQKLEAELGPLAVLIQNRAFDRIAEWLRENIHLHGSLFTAEELSLRVAGHPLDARIFVEALRDKLRQAYGLPSKPTAERAT